MQPVTKKIHGYDDMISQLPEPIIGHILECMPLPDAARTSVLSREWRFKWFNVSKIVCRSKPGESRPRIEKLLLGIIQLLQQGDGAIRVFILYVPDHLKSCTEIDEISKLVFKKGCVQKILFVTQEGRSHILDSSLFSCPQLSHLFLRGFVFQPPLAFKGFSKLVSLLLLRVTITTQVLSTLISQSPLLEFLWLNSCAPANLEVTAHNLKFFFCRGFYRTLIFVAAPRLDFVSLKLPVSRPVMALADDSTVLQLKSVDSIVSLHLDYHYMKSLHRCGSGSKFGNLRAVRLSGICFGITHEVKCVLELMKGCASLETIIIEAFHVATAEHDDDVVKLCEGLDLSCSRIREVHVLDVSGSKTELAFIKTLLLKLQQLETMIIAPELKNVGDEGFDICKLVCQFRRTSPLAAIEFRDLKDCKELLNRQELEFIKSYFRIHSIKVQRS